MVNKEIIIGLKYVKEELHKLLINPYSWVYQPIDDAIKALEQSRDMKEIEEIINCDADAETKCKMISNILTAKPHYFEDQDVGSPSVQPKPKTGHWILEIEDWKKWKCSECGFSKRTDIHVRLGYNYCPNCGLKMVKPQESEDEED